MASEPSNWLVENDELGLKNIDLMSYLASDFDPHAVQMRLALYNEQTYSDRDRIRVAGKYYNNIQLGKRMFGPSKKQKFICSITGGMERRVVLHYPPNNENDFIHANYVCGGPLFNKFIVTQAPMENTVDDFWRWFGKKKRHISSMLIGRKVKDRCAEYWPRRPESNSIDVCGLHIHNVGISSTRDPVFRVTYLRILNDSGEEVRNGCNNRLVYE
ncbi:hypothetical protein COOONC_03749 [Cooperia oncophora]